MIWVTISPTKASPSNASILHSFVCGDMQTEKLCKSWKSITKKERCEPSTQRKLTKTQAKVKHSNESSIVSYPSLPLEQLVYSYPEWRLIRGQHNTCMLICSAICRSTQFSLGRTGSPCEMKKGVETEQRFLWSQIFYSIDNTSVNRDISSLLLSSPCPTSSNLLYLHK